MIEKICLQCGKSFNTKYPQQKYCRDKCNDLAYYYRNRTEKLRYQKDYNLKNHERDKLKNANRMRKWYSKNKERQYSNIKKDYQRNKLKWIERRFTNNMRETLLSLINLKCECGDIVRVIHHEEYVDFKLSQGTRDISFLVLYATRLKGFCSTKCHQNYHYKIKHNL